VPLVYWSTQLWRTQHPKNTVVGGLDNSMRPAFYLSLVMFNLFFVLLYGVRKSMERARRRLTELELAAEEAGLEDA
jgi:hypothetical protein